MRVESSQSRISSSARSYCCRFELVASSVRIRAGAQALGLPTPEPVDFTSGFRYIDKLVREEGAWRIAERFALREWTRCDVGYRDPEGSGPRGARDRSDPVYRLLDDLERAE